MKKFSLFLLALVMVSSLTACETNETYALYSEMSKNMDNITSIDMDTSVWAQLDLAGEVIEMQMAGSTKQIFLDNDIQQEMIMETTMMGMTIPMTSYYKEGYFYQEVMGMRQKIPMDVEVVAGQNYSTMVSFTDSAVVDSTLTELGDGRTQLDFTLSGEALSDSLSEMAASMYEGMGVSPSGTSFSDVDYTVIVGENKMMETMVLFFEMDMTVEGMDCTMAMEIECDVVSYNSVTEIDFPADLDEY